MKPPSKPKKRPPFGRKGVPKWKKDKPSAAKVRAVSRMQARGLFPA